MPAAGSVEKEVKEVELLKLYVEVWGKAVETQMHFNEMSAKSRQLGLTFVAATLGLALLMISRGDEFSILIWGFNLHLAVPLMAAAAFALYAVKVLDLGVYHKMLRGAVTFGEDLERRVIVPMLGTKKGMTEAISHFSRFEDAKFEKVEVGGLFDFAYLGSVRRSAESKIGVFYKVTISFLLGSAALVLILTSGILPN